MNDIRDLNYKFRLVEYLKRQINLHCSLFKSEALEIHRLDMINNEKYMRTIFTKNFICEKNDSSLCILNISFSC